MTDDRFETINGFKFRLRKRSGVIDIAALDHLACWFTICRMSTFDSAILYAANLADYWATAGDKPFVEGELPPAKIYYTPPVSR